jgi:hypothetical protein
MRKLGRKLTLNRETLRQLTDREMSRAVGGKTDTFDCPTGRSCPRTACTPTECGFSCSGMQICQQTDPACCGHQTMINC